MADRKCKKCDRECGDVSKPDHVPFHDAPDGEGFICAKCFVCKQCSKSMEEEDEFFTLSDGCFQCSDCNDNEKEKCTACGKIFETGYVEVEHGKFHKECFVCSECKKSIAGGYKAKEGGIFLCSRCAAPNCSQCNKKILKSGRMDSIKGLICLTCAGMPEQDEEEDADLSALNAKTKVEQGEEGGPGGVAFNGADVDAARQAFLNSQSSVEKAAAERAAREKAEADRIAAELAAAEAAARAKREAEKAAAAKAAAEKEAADALAVKLAAAKAASDAAAEQMARDKAAREKAAADKAAADAAAGKSTASEAPVVVFEVGAAVPEGYKPPILTLAELQDAAIWKPKGVHPAKREMSLSDADFNKFMGLNKDEFVKAPMWKQQKLKKEHNLY